VLSENYSPLIYRLNLAELGFDFAFRGGSLENAVDLVTSVKSMVDVCVNLMLVDWWSLGGVPFRNFCYCLV
jgi:hypothetical protein